MTFLKELQTLKIPLVLSSLIESGVGILAIAKWGAFCSSIPGLDTYRYLADDVLKNPLIFSEGKLLPSNPELKKEKLEVIYEI